MAKTRAKAKGRKDLWLFVMLRHDLIDHPDYLALSHPAKTLLVDVLRHYNGSNNGDFAITLSVMSKRGWTSKDTLVRATKELIEADLLMLTRQGGRHRCNLYAVTFWPIDECSGKLDVPSTTTPPRKLDLKNTKPGPSDGLQVA